MPQSDPGLLEQAAIGLSAIAAGISSWAWIHTHGLIGKKAEIVTVNALLERFEGALKDHREDMGKIFDKINSVADSHNAFARECIAELGKRPTRDECVTLWNHNKK